MSWRLCQAGQRFRDEVDDVWPGTVVWTVGDPDHAARPSDHNPYDHDDDPATAEVVTAIDVVGAEQADGAWSFLLATRPERVEYAIHDGQQVGADTGWQVVPYRGPNPHKGHTHVSFGRGTDARPTRPDLYDDPSPFGLANRPLEADVSWITRKWPTWFHDVAEEMAAADLIYEDTEPSRRLGDWTAAQLFVTLYRFGRWIIREVRR